MDINPDLRWYKGESERRNSPTRCPHAHVKRCPRFYYSSALLSEIGYVRKMKPELERELDELWAHSRLTPLSTAQEPGVTSYGERVSQYDHFCPEVLFEAFKLFATDLYHFADEIDKDSMHQALKGISNPPEWRWRWAHCEPLHYLDCAVYSQIERPALEKEQDEKEEVLVLKPSFHGITLDLKSLAKRVKQVLQSFKNRT